ncbi:MAG: alpha/beta hydrolase, partial [Roseiflexaceae bacterium]
GHSYGGVVITEAGNDPAVAGLVYVAAFAPDTGESVATLIKDPLPGAPVPPILPPQDGYLFLDKAKFHAAFAADVDVEKAAFMADSQVPWGVGALSGEISEPAWKTKPSWYLVATDDRMIPPSAQRFMSERAGSTVIEAPGSHAIYVSDPPTLLPLCRRRRAGLAWLYLRLGCGHSGRAVAPGPAAHPRSNPPGPPRAPRAVRGDDLAARGAVSV